MFLLLSVSWVDTPSHQFVVKHPQSHSSYFAFWVCKVCKVRLWVLMD